MQHFADEIMNSRVCPIAVHTANMGDNERLEIKLRVEWQRHMRTTKIAAAISFPL